MFQPQADAAPDNSIEPLAGPLLKLTRATDHFAELMRIVGEFMAGGDAFSTASEFDLSRNSFAVRALNVRHIDPRHGVVLGDLVHNLRSALDQLAWTLVERGGTSLSKDQARNVFFPIRMQEEQWDDALQKNLPGVDPVHRQIVERYQPFQRGPQAPDHPLAILRELSNDDKHRILRLTRYMISKSEYEPDKEGFKGCRFVDMELTKDHRGDIDEGTVLAFIRVADVTTAAPRAAGTFRFRATPSFSPSRRAEDTIGWMQTSVREVIDEFRRIL